MKFRKANTGTPPLEKKLHLRDDLGLKRLGNFFNNDGIIMLHVDATEANPSQCVNPEGFEHYEWLDETPDPTYMEVIDGKEVVYADSVHTWTHVVVDFIDRVRILFRGKCSVDTTVYTEGKVKVLYTTGRFIAEPVFKKKQKCYVSSGDAGCENKKSEKEPLET